VKLNHAQTAYTDSKPQKKTQESRNFCIIHAYSNLECKSETKLSRRNLKT